jgi:hypothetical protein
VVAGPGMHRCRCLTLSLLCSRTGCAALNPSDGLQPNPKCMNCYKLRANS